MRVAIVGGNAAGASAATRLARLRPDWDIVVFERTQNVSFANCGLLYHIEGVIPERSQLFVETAESLKAKYHLDIRLRHEVVGVNPSAHLLQVRDAASGATMAESYDKLILATGSEPVRPAVPGISGQEDIVTMWTVADMDRIIQRITSGVKSVAIVGGGYVGCILSEALRQRGLSVALIEAEAHILPFLDADIASYAQEEMVSHGVALHVGDTVQGFTQTQGGGQQLLLQNGVRLQADLVVLAVGVRPNAHLAQDAGLAIGETGGVLVGPNLRTSDPDIYAVGDAIEVSHAVTGQHMTMALAGPAHRQARIVADNVAGLGEGWEEHYTGTQASMVAKLWQITAGATGANSAQLQRRGIAFRSVLIHAPSHASYYPGAFPVHIKLLFGTDGRILGGQAAGRDGIAKRLDVVATAIYFGGHVGDLDNLQLTYSPPISTARDAVNIAGSAAEAVLTSERR